MRTKKVPIPKSVSEFTDVDHYVVDTLFPYPDDIDSAYDLYTLLAAEVHYQTLQTRYGLFKIDSFLVESIPWIMYSSTFTDCAVGYFAVRQGVFDITVTTKGAGATFSMPDSRGINNHKILHYYYQLTDTQWYPGTQANTADSIVPKINVYFGWYHVATTNAHNGLVRIRVKMSFRNKLA